MPNFIDELKEHRQGLSEYLVKLTQHMMHNELLSVGEANAHFMAHAHPQLQTMLQGHIRHTSEVHSHHQHVVQSHANQIETKHCKPPVTALKGLIQCMLYQDFNNQTLRPELCSLGEKGTLAQTLVHGLATHLNDTVETIKPYFDEIIQAHPTFDADLEALYDQAQVSNTSLWQALWQYTLTSLSTILTRIPLNKTYDLEQALFKLKIIDTTPETHTAYLVNLITEQHTDAFHGELLKLWKRNTTDRSAQSFRHFVIETLNRQGVHITDTDLLDQAIKNIITLNSQSLNVDHLSTTEVNLDAFIAHVRSQFKRRHHIIFDTLGLYACNIPESLDIQALTLEAFTALVTELHADHQQKFTTHYQNLLQTNASMSIYSGNKQFVYVLYDYWQRWRTLVADPSPGMDIDLNQGALFAQSQHYSLIAYDGNPRCFRGLNEEAQQNILGVSMNNVSVQQSSIQRALRNMASSLFELIDIDQPNQLMRIMAWWHIIRPHLRGMPTIISEYYDTKYKVLYPEEDPVTKAHLYNLQVTLAETLMNETGLSLHGARAILDYLNLYYFKFIKKTQDPQTLWAYIDRHAEYAESSHFTDDARIISYEKGIQMRQKFFGAVDGLFKCHEPLPNGAYHNQHLRVFQPHLFNAFTARNTHTSTFYYMTIQFPHTLHFFESFIKNGHFQPMKQLAGTPLLTLNFILCSALIKPESLDAYNYDNLCKQYLNPNIQSCLQANIQDTGFFNTVAALLIFLMHDTFYQQSSSPVSSLKKLLELRSCNTEKLNQINAIILALEASENNALLNDIKYNWLALTRAWIQFDDTEYHGIEPSDRNNANHELRGLHFEGPNLPLAFDAYMENNALDLSPKPSLEDIPMHAALDWSEKVAYFHYLSKKPSLTPHQTILKDHIEFEARNDCISIFHDRSMFKPAVCLRGWLRSSCHHARKTNGEHYFKTLGDDQSPIPNQWAWILCHMDLLQLQLSGLKASQMKQLSNQLETLKTQYPAFTDHLNSQKSYLERLQSKGHCLIA